MTYLEFLRTKIEIAPETGFEVGDGEIHPALKPHQRDAVRWALRGGRRALFEASVWVRPCRSWSFAGRY